MNFGDQYDTLPSKAQEVIKAYLCRPNEDYRQYVVGYVDALEDCGVISHEANSFWRTETPKMMIDNHYFERYFG